jgi:hypothetical protein
MVLEVLIMADEGLQCGAQSAVEFHRALFHEASK